MSLEIHINPLVNWIWMGFGIMAFGTGIALLPESTFAFATAKLPAGAATTTLSVLLAVALLLGGGSRASAQMTGDAATQTSFYARTPFEAKMQHEIVCTCGCGHITIAECRKDPCVTSHEMRGELAGYIDQGKIARGDHPGVHHDARQPGNARRAARRGIQPPRLALSVPRRRDRRHRHRADREEVDAPGGPRGRAGRADRRRPRRTSRR